MSTEQIKELLAQLQDEIQKTELDDETRSLVRQLDTDIHGLLAADADQPEAGSPKGGPAFSSEFLFRRSALPGGINGSDRVPGTIDDVRERP